MLDQASPIHHHFPGFPHIEEVLQPFECSREYDADKMRLGNSHPHTVECTVRGFVYVTAAPCCNNHKPVGLVRYHEKVRDEVQARASVDLVQVPQQSNERKI